jgi:hypothetical protein
MQLREPSQLGPTSEWFRSSKNWRNSAKCALKFKRGCLPATLVFHPIARIRLYGGDFANELMRFIQDSTKRCYAMPSARALLISSSLTPWWGGMVPNPNSRWFETKLEPSFRGESRTISEADAVLSLVRLDLVREIGKVRRCQLCQERWRVAAKSSYRFCSAKCREEFYKRLPEYHSRKAANQRAFRKRLKQRKTEW